MRIKVRELAELLDGELIGDGEVEITGVAGIKEAGPGDVTFLADRKYESWLKTTQASAVIMNGEGAELDKPVIRNPNPYLAFLKAVRLFHGDKTRVEPGVHPTCVLGDGVSLGKDVHLGPHVVVGRGARIGNGTVVMAGCYVGPDVVIGSGVYVHPNVTIREDTVIGDRVIIHSGTVIGSDGFGYAKEGRRYHKIPHVGRVVVEEDVEIGANVAIDRATTGVTHIKRGVKIDNLVHIAHNVVVDEDTIILAQVGIAGSTEIGKNVILAGQAGLVAHIRIGDNARVGSQAGVTKSVPPDTSVSGYPAAPHSHAKRIHACLHKLPDIIKKVKEIERRLQELEREKAE